MIHLVHVYYCEGVEYLSLLDGDCCFCNGDCLDLGDGTCLQVEVDTDFICFFAMESDFYDNLCIFLTFIVLEQFFQFLSIFIVYENGGDVGFVTFINSNLPYPLSFMMTRLLCS